MCCKYGAVCVLIGRLWLHLLCACKQTESPLAAPAVLPGYCCILHINYRCIGSGAVQLRTGRLAMHGFLSSGCLGIIHILLLGTNSFFSFWKLGP